MSNIEQDFLIQHIAHKIVYLLEQGDVPAQEIKAYLPLATPLLYAVTYEIVSIYQERISELCRQYEPIH